MGNVRILRTIEYHTGGERTTALLLLLPVLHFVAFTLQVYDVDALSINSTTAGVASLG
jgi:hypothetical protein